MGEGEPKEAPIQWHPLEHMPFYEQPTTEREGTIRTVFCLVADEQQNTDEEWCWTQKQIDVTKKSAQCTFWGLFEVVDGRWVETEHWQKNNITRKSKAVSNEDLPN